MNQSHAHPANPSSDLRRPLSTGLARWSPWHAGGDERRILFELGRVAAAICLLAAWIAWHPVKPSVFALTYNCFSDLIYLAAAGLCLTAALTPAGDGRSPSCLRRAPMLLIALSAALFAAGNVIWSWYVIVKHDPAPFPSWADAGYLSNYPCLFFGILLLPSKPIPVETRGRVIFDSLITLGIFSTLSWYYVLGPTIQQGHGSLAAKVLSVGYPMGDLVLLTCLLVLAAQSRDSMRPRVLAFMAAGLVSIIVSDVLFAYRNLQGTYHDGSLLDVGWPLGYLLFGIALRAFRRDCLECAARPAASDEPALPIIPPLWRALAPYALLPLVACLILHMRAAAGDERLEGGVYLGALLVVMLLIFRQGAAMAQLVRDLRERVGELEAAKSQLTSLAERDGLTGLYNHRALHAQVESDLVSGGVDPVSLIAMDMDGFKAINDTYGHPAGDQLLRHLAALLERVFTGSCRIGRCGGDEFLVLLPGSAAKAARLTDKLLEEIARHPFDCPGGGRIPVRVCFGVADSLQSPTGTQDAKSRTASLIAAADNALYESKRRGGGRVTVHGQFSEMDSDGTDRAARSSYDVLDGLITAIDNKDRFTRRHSEDVTRYCLMIVEALGLSEDTVSAMRTAGLLHDVGKIGIPDAILRKPGRLTADEYEIMKSHVTLSTLIIHNLPRLTDIMDGVAHHHERWDGRGYPNGTSGRDIPLLGRIMCIADAFSAMTLDRNYHAGMPIQSALAEIERGAGTQFDPEIAMLFVALMSPQATGRQTRPLLQAA